MVFLPAMPIRVQPVESSGWITATSVSEDERVPAKRVRDTEHPTELQQESTNSVVHPGEMASSRNAVHQVKCYNISHEK